MLADRVKETTATTGTGTVTLAGAASGYRAFSAAFSNGDLVRYVIAGGAEWEIGIGVYSAGSISRNAVTSSSNGGALVNFSAGSKDVFCTVSAGDIVPAGRDYAVVRGYAMP